MHELTDGDEIRDVVVRQARRLRTRLAVREDSEHIFLLNKVVISTMLMTIVVLFASGRNLVPVLALYGAFVLGDFLLLTWLVVRPNPSPSRRVIGMMLDVCSIGVAQNLGGLLATGLAYASYLLIIFGNAFRFGGLYLSLATLGSILALGFNVLATPAWDALQALGWGLVVGLVLLPAYAYKLMRVLIAARDRAEDNARAKGRFLASISHEFRTPLNAVIGLGDLLAVSPLPPQEASWARTIAVAGRSLLDQVNAILDFSRFDAGQMPLHREPIDLIALAGSVRDVLLPQAQAKGLNLGLQVHLPLEPHVVASARHLRDALTNLGSNAIKFTEKGHVVISLATITCTAERRTIRFEVRDTGIGIEPDALPRLFDPFVQANDTIVDRFGGTGLGLALVRELVLAMGGELGVSSEPGRGSCFRFDVTFDSAPVRGANGPAPVRTLGPADPHRPLIAACGRDSAFDPAAGQFALILPTNATSADRAQAEVLAQRMVGVGQRHNSGIQRAARSLRLLVAEDNATNRLVVERILTGAGHAVTLANDGREALAVLQRQTFDLVMLDLNMPVLNGYEAARHYLARAHCGPPSPLVALTADATPETRARCLAAGMVDCLVKPIEPQVFLRAVEILARAQPLGEDRGGGRNAETNVIAFGARALDSLTSLGGDDFVHEVATQFVRDANELLDAVRTSARAGELAGVRDHLHALRSCAAHVGADALETFCRTFASVDDIARLQGVSETAAQLQDDLRRFADQQDRRAA